MRKRAHLGLALISASSIGLLAGAAHANDRDVLSTTIPAAACQPADTDDAAKVTLFRTTWSFRSGVTGTVTFYCPLGINQHTVSDDTNDNDITRFRVYYDDSDGRGNQAAVRVQLLRWVGGRMELIPGSFWSSNQRAETRGFTVGYHSLPYDLQGDSLYSFMVVMYRRSAENTAGFAGIDFPFIPPPFEGPARPIR